MKRALIFSVFIALAFGGLWLWRDVGLKLEMREGVKSRNDLESARSLAFREETARLFDELMSGVGEKEEWDSAIKVAKNLSEKDKTRFAVLAKGKLFEAMFNEAETLLFKARLILDGDKQSSVGRRYLAEARVIYQKMSELIGELKDVGDDPEWNANINYLLGLYCFRSIFFAKENEVGALVARSANHFAAVFRHRPKHRDAEVALEILQQTFKGQGNDSGDNNKLKLLPQTDPGFIISGRGRGRH
mgnify:CR=1 FL=1